jgi:hypothetical protein
MDCGDAALKWKRPYYEVVRVHLTVDVTVWEEELAVKDFHIGRFGARLVEELNCDDDHQRALCVESFQALFANLVGWCYEHTIGDVLFSRYKNRLVPTGEGSRTAVAIEVLRKRLEKLGRGRPSGASRLHATHYETFIGNPPEVGWDDWRQGRLPLD